MSWRRVSKDAAHPGAVAACRAVGIGILEVNAGHWGGGPEHMEMQAVGASDFVLALRGFVAAVELKTPGADHGGSQRRKKRDEKQSAFLAMMSACGLPGFRCVGTLEVLAVMGCTAAEARRGMIAACGETWCTAHVVEMEAKLAEARQRLGWGQPPHVTTKRVPTAAYVPPRTDFGQCEARFFGRRCDGLRFTHDSRFCADCHMTEALAGAT